jgi:mannose-6-phosphate isomerase class I
VQKTLQAVTPGYAGKTLSSYLGERPELLGKAGEKFGNPVEAKGERFLPFLMKVLTCKQGQLKRVTRIER